MPALIHCRKSGAHKARVAALRTGEFTDAFSFGEAHGLRMAARSLGLRAAVNRTAGRGENTFRITLLPTPAAKNS